MVHHGFTEGWQAAGMQNTISWMLRVRLFYLMGVLSLLAMAHVLTAG
ncbi:hypothetical protein Rhal01_02641 [Rubritalea halochordaticola]|uniref:Uncharacterized protein n=1 Tax=Rubritalea halochordaticola TaxID=714537 RepID=A0ABP9V530_9BACT